MKATNRKLRLVLVCFSAVFLSSSLLETINSGIILCWASSTDMNSTSEVQEPLKGNAEVTDINTGCFGPIHNEDVDLVESTELIRQHNPLLCQANLTKQRGFEAIDLLQDRGEAPQNCQARPVRKNHSRQSCPSIRPLRRKLIDISRLTDLGIRWHQQTKRVSLFTTFRREKRLSRLTKINL